jgi:Xaa-Pro aminopeptidase
MTGGFRMGRFSISEDEYRHRIEHVRRILSKRKVDALYLTNGTSMFYLTGYSFISTERPAALVIPVDGKTTFLGPLLEKDHVPLETRLIEDVRTYVDYPGEKHPIDWFAEFLTNMNLSHKKIGTDNMVGASALWGYRGPPLPRKLSNAKFVDMSELIASMRLIKSDEEIELMKESCKWANLAMTLMQEYADEGLWDVEVELAASQETASIMKKTLGSDYVPKRSIVPAVLYFRGQVGEMSAIPHSMATRRVITNGDVLIGEVGVDIGGYSCELERTMIVGKPSPKHKRYFDAMVKAQKAAFEAFKPNAKCSDIDKATVTAFKKAGLIQLVKHHTGHGLGLEGHEPPWLDMGNDEPLKAGMIVSCEPGIYETGFAGFRHSDTVLAMGYGAEILTYYPRSIEDLIIE